MIAILLVLCPIQTAEMSYLSDSQWEEYRDRRASFQHMLADLANYYYQSMDHVKEFPPFEDFYGLVNLYLSFDYPFYESAYLLSEKERRSMAQQEYEVHYAKWRHSRPTSSF